MKLLMSVAFSLLLPALSYASNPATTLSGTTVENVDTAKQTLSIKTRDGQSYTLHVNDPELLKKHDLKKGDLVTLEVDTNDHIIQIAKAANQTN